MGSYTTEQAQHVKVTWCFEPHVCVCAGHRSLTIGLVLLCLAALVLGRGLLQFGLGLPYFPVHPVELLNQGSSKRDHSDNCQQTGGPQSALSMAVSSSLLTSPTSNAILKLCPPH